MKAGAATKQAKSPTSERAGKARIYLAGRHPILVPVSPELGEEIERKTEWYRLRTRREQNAFIKGICHQIVEAFKPDKIILFGSRAYGNPREDSDIDLLVLMPYTGSSAAQAVRILHYIDMFVPIDLLVRTSREVRERIKIGDQFMREIVERGKVMYEADHKGMGQKGRRRLA